MHAEAESEGFWYPAVGLDQQVRRGELLGHLETLSGHRLQEVRAEFDGIVLYYTIALGVRADTTLLDQLREKYPLEVLSAGDVDGGANLYDATHSAHFAALRIL